MAEHQNDLPKHNLQEFDKDSIRIDDPSFVNRRLHKEKLVDKFSSTLPQNYEIFLPNVKTERFSDESFTGIALEKIIPKTPVTDSSFFRSTDEPKSSNEGSVTNVIKPSDESLLLGSTSTTVSVNPVALTLVTNPSISHQIHKRSINNDEQSSHMTLRAPRGRDIMKDDLAKSGRRSEADPDIDDIIQGIMQLLGGNVKIDAATTTDTKLTTMLGDLSTYSTRTNDRGPPRLPLNPFNFFNGGNRQTRTRPPIRPPVATPVGNIPLPGRPSFMANTLPPFLATLPPELDKPRPQLPSQNPTLSALPNPVNIPQSSMVDEDLPVVFPTLTPTPTVTFTSKTPTAFHEEMDPSSVVFPDETITISSSTTAPNTVGPVLSESTVPSTDDDGEVFFSTETSLEKKPSASETEVPPPDSADSQEVETTPSEIFNILSSASLPTFLSTTTSEISNFPSMPTITVPPYQPDFTSSRPSPSNTIPTISPSSAVFATATAIPTPYRTPALPSRHTPAYHRPGVVLDATYPVPVITSPPNVGQVFDVTVSAHQGFGGRPPPVRPLLPSYNNIPMAPNFNIHGKKDLLFW